MPPLTECLPCPEVLQGPGACEKAQPWGRPEAEAEAAVRQLFARILVGQETEQEIWHLAFSFFSLLFCLELQPME